MNPTINPQDYITNMERSNPPDNVEPFEIYVVFYRGDSGQWIWNIPTFYKEHAERFARCLNRPTQILTYQLTANEVVLRRRVRQPTKPKRIRRVRTV